MNNKKLNEGVVRWNPFEKPDKINEQLTRLGLTRKCEHGPNSKCVHCMYLDKI